MSKRLQTQTGIAKVLQNLLTTGIRTEILTEVSTPIGAISSYRYPDGRLSGALWVDAHFAAGTCAALCLLPPEAVQEALDIEPRLPKRWHEHYREVANICTRFFGSLEAPRVVLDKVWIAPDNPPESLMAEMSSLLEHRVLTIELGSYGVGALHMVATG